MVIYRTVRFLIISLKESHQESNYTYYSKYVNFGNTWKTCLQW